MNKAYVLSPLGSKPQMLVAQLKAAGLLPDRLAPRAAEWRFFRVPEEFQGYRRRAGPVGYRKYACLLSVPFHPFLRSKESRQENRPPFLGLFGVQIPLGPTGRSYPNWNTRRARPANPPRPVFHPSPTPTHSSSQGGTSVADLDSVWAFFSPSTMPCAASTATRRFDRDSAEASRRLRPRIDRLLRESARESARLGGFFRVSTGWDTEQDAEKVRFQGAKSRWCAVS